MSREHLDRYVNDFAGRHNIRTTDTREQVASGVIGRRLMCRDLIAEQNKPLDAGNDVFQASGLLVPSLPSSAVASSDGPILRVLDPLVG